MKTALIQPPVWGVYDPPAGLAQISGYLKKFGCEVDVFDLNIEFYRSRKQEYNSMWAIEQSSFWTNNDNVNKYFNDNSALVNAWVDKIAAGEPGLVGISVNVCSLHPALKIAGMLKKKLPNVKIAAGGPMFCVPADVGVILNDSPIDIVVYGEGEQTFKELACIMNAGGSPDSCRGIYLKKEGSIFKTDTMPPLKNLDELPYLDFCGFPAEKYDPPGHLGEHISLMTSRGCVQQCVFCGPKAYWPGYRTMGGKRIYDEICHHLRTFPLTAHIEFLDLLFNGSMNTLNEFCGLMISSPPKAGLKWHANLIIRPEMTDTVFLKMKSSGCEHVTYGIESGSQRVLDHMRKRYRVEDADRVLRSAHGAGIQVTCNFMFGFPGETNEDFGATLSFLERNAAYIDTAYPSRTFFTIEPHSYLESHLKEFEIVPNSEHGQYWVSSDGRNDYPERMKRCEEFSKRAISLGVNVGLGLQTSVELDRWFNLGNYYEMIKDYKNALISYNNYLKLDPHNAVINSRYDLLKQKKH